jgi:hypothetical protein
MRKERAVSKGLANALYLSLCCLSRSTSYVTEAPEADSEAEFTTRF